MTTTEITPFTRPDDVWDDAHALASLRTAILVELDEDGYGGIARTRAESARFKHNALLDLGRITRRIAELERIAAMPTAAMTREDFAALHADQHDALRAYSHLFLALNEHDRDDRKIDAFRTAARALAERGDPDANTALGRLRDDLARNMRTATHLVQMPGVAIDDQITILNGWIGHLMGQMTLTRVAGDLH